MRVLWCKLLLHSIKPHHTLVIPKDRHWFLHWFPCFSVSTKVLLSCTVLRMVSGVFVLPLYSHHLVTWQQRLLSLDFLILQAYSFCWTLLSPKHSCLLTVSQRELEINTTSIYIYISCNLWIGREPSTPIQQPHVRGGSDPQLSAHCLF